MLYIFPFSYFRILLPTKRLKMMLVLAIILPFAAGQWYNEPQGYNLNCPVPNKSPSCADNEFACNGRYVDGCLQDSVCIKKEPSHCGVWCPSWCNFEQGAIHCPAGLDPNGCPVHSGSCMGPTEYDVGTDGEKCPSWCRPSGWNPNDQQCDHGYANNGCWLGFHFASDCGKK